MVSDQRPRSSRCHLGRTAPLAAMPEAVKSGSSLKRTAVQFAIPEAMGPDRLPNRGITVAPSEPEPQDDLIIGSPNCSVIPENVMVIRAGFLSAKAVKSPDKSSVLITFKDGKTVNIPVPADAIVKLPSRIQMSLSMDGIDGIASAISRFCKGKMIERVTLIPSCSQDYNELLISPAGGGIFVMMVSPPPSRMTTVPLPEILNAKCLSCMKKDDTVNISLDDGRTILMQTQASDISICSSASLSRHVITDKLPSKKVEGTSGLSIELERLIMGKSILSIQNDEGLFGAAQAYIRLEDENLYRTIVVKTDKHISFSMVTSV